MIVRTFVYLGVRHPATGLHLIGVETPKVELLLEQRAAHIGRIMEFPRAIVVEHLGEDTRMPVEEVLVQDRVVIGQSLGQLGQPGRGDLLEGRLVRLVPDTAHVQGHAVLRIRV